MFCSERRGVSSVCLCLFLLSLLVALATSQRGRSVNCNKIEVKHHRNYLRQDEVRKYWKNYLETNDESVDCRIKPYAPKCRGVTKRVGNIFYPNQQRQTYTQRNTDQFISPEKQQLPYWFYTAKNYQ